MHIISINIIIHVSLNENNNILLYNIIIVMLHYYMKNYKYNII